MGMLRILKSVNILNGELAFSAITHCSVEDVSTVEGVLGKEGMHTEILYWIKDKATCHKSKHKN